MAPSPALRHWFGHDPEKWPEFRRRYFEELQSREEALAPLRAAARLGRVTLVYGARDTEHNAAAALRDYLTGHQRAGPTSRRREPAVSRGGD